MCTALERLAEENRQRGIAQGIAQGIEQGIERGFAQGIEQGIERGITQGRCEERDMVVKALLLQGLLPEQKIAEAMKVSMEKLQEIKQECRVE